jgi:hypothetical protein
MDTYSVDKSQPAVPRKYYTDEIWNIRKLMQVVMHHMKMSRGTAQRKRHVSDLVAYPATTQKTEKRKPTLYFRVREGSP